MKLLGIGLDKTCAKKLDEYMRTFGILNYSYDLKLIEDFFNNNLDAIYRISDAYMSFEDWLWPLFYKEVDQKYGDAKYI